MAPKPPTSPAGRRVLRQVLVALTLTSFIPMLVVAYCLYAYVLLYTQLLPFNVPLRPVRNIQFIVALLVFTGILMGIGAFMLWDLARAVARTLDTAAVRKPPAPAAKPATAPARAEAPAPHAPDDVDALMHAFSRMLGTIEQRAAELNQFSERLESAYKELESTSARLKEFSFKDEVTGLYNRRFFTIRLEEEVSRYRRFNHPVSVVLLDLDGFKAINDELGHVAGDETLRGVAEILLKHSRGINVICRYGGDEFAVLLVETSKAGARLYADRIRYVLSNHAFSHGRRVTASFGLASLPEDVAPGTEELIRAADEALYAAKRAGKNRVSVHEDIGGGAPAMGSGTPIR
jgi:diguanylate cyclase (GGDEF)-like protein